MPHLARLPSCILDTRTGRRPRLGAADSPLGRCPQGDSNARTRLRRPVLYPLSYGGRWRAFAAPSPLYHIAAAASSRREPPCRSVSTVVVLVVSYQRCTSTRLARITAPPTTVCGVTVSPSSSAPSATATTGSR